MEFRVLGPIELWSAGQQCDLGPTRVRCVLAILMLTPRTLVPTDVLIDRVWDTEPPPKARESLSVYITRLRASLRQAIGDGIRLTGRDSGYELDIEPGTVDLHQFRRLRGRADALAVNGDCDQAVSLLREADLLWHGQALAGDPRRLGGAGCGTVSTRNAGRPSSSASNASWSSAITPTWSASSAICWPSIRWTRR